MKFKISYFVVLKDPKFGQFVDLKIQNQLIAKIEVLKVQNSSKMAIFGWFLSKLANFRIWLKLGFQCFTCEINKVVESYLESFRRFKISGFG